MKIAFDENIPMGMVRVFQALANERQLRRQMGDFEIVSARAYAPHPSDADYIKKSDVPWVDRFAGDSGRMIVSGDCRMLERVHERLALQRLGFVVIFFERKWSEWDFFRKSSLLLHYWPKIAHRVRRVKPGTFLRVPGHWREDGELLNVPPTKGKISKVGPPAGRKVSKGGRKSGVRRRRGSVRTEVAKDRSAPIPSGEKERQGELDLHPPKPRKKKTPAK